MFYIFIIAVSLFFETNLKAESLSFSKFGKVGGVIDSVATNDVCKVKQKKTLCLNMIVKNESKVIKRCLASLKHLIDYWVIVDTGSSDGTQEIIREFMKDIPGELHERKWENFEVNRNQALKLARSKADYLLFIDADEELIFNENFEMPALDSDAYYITCGCEGMEFLRVGLISNRIDWKYEGVLHEVICSEQAKSYIKLKNVHNLIRREGCRSQDPNRSLKDIEIFENLLKKNPNDSRSVYYLANTYLQIKNYAKALKFYEKRVTMSQLDEEVFLSYLSIAQLHQTMNKPMDVVVESYYKAYTSRSNRSEPLFFLANYYRMNKKFHEAFTIASFGVRLSFPDESLIIEKWVYDYGLFFELAVSAFELKRYTDAYLGFLKILGQNVVHEHILSETKKYISIIEGKIIAGEISNMQAKIDHGM